VAGGRAGLEEEVLGAQAAGRAVDVEGVGLPSRAVEREHQEGSPPLPDRMFGDERLQLGDHLALVAAAEVGLETILECLEAQLVQALGLAAKRLGGQAGEGGAAPEGEGVPEELCGPLGVA